MGDLTDGLERLLHRDPEAAVVLVLTWRGRLSSPEIAEILDNLGPADVAHCLRRGKAMLRRLMEENAAAADAAQASCWWAFLLARFWRRIARAVLWKRLDRLAPRASAALLLVKHGWTPKEIAIETGQGEPAIARFLTKARVLTTPHRHRAFQKFLKDWRLRFGNGEAGADQLWELLDQEQRALLVPQNPGRKRFTFGGFLESMRGPVSTHTKIVKRERQGQTWWCLVDGRIDL